MTILPTGNKHSESAMTLIEVLISVSILSAGLMVVYAPLLSSLTAMQYSDYRLEANRLISNYFWEKKIAIKKNAGALLPNESGSWIEGAHFIRYVGKAKPISVKQDLNEVNVSALWVMGGQTKEMNRTTYLADERRADGQNEG